MNDRVVIDYDSPEYAFSDLLGSLAGLFEKKAWWKEAYWAIYRFFKYKLNPIRWYDKIKSFVQRGRKGWADVDTWSIGYHFAVRMRDAIAFSMPHEYGYPAELVEENDPEGEIGFATWQNIQDDIIWGLDHYIAACDFKETCSCCGRYCNERECPIIQEAFSSLMYWWSNLGS